jgi:hypothetical protein
MAAPSTGHRRGRYRVGAVLMSTWSASNDPLVAIVVVCRRLQKIVLRDWADMLGPI